MATLWRPTLPACCFFFCIFLAEKSLQLFISLSQCCAFGIRTPSRDQNKCLCDIFFLRERVMNYCYCWHAGLKIIKKNLPLTLQAFNIYSKYIDICHYSALIITLNLILSIYNFIESNYNITVSAFVFVNWLY